MQVQRLVEPSAEMVTVTTVKPGDVYKRLVEPSYGTGDSSIQLGVVTDVMHNGTDAAITSIEFGIDFRDVKPQIKVFGTRNAPQIFAAQPDEITLHLEELRSTIAQQIESAEKKLSETRAIEQMVNVKLAGLPELSSPATKPYTEVQAIEAADEAQRVADEGDEPVEAI